MHTLWLLLWVTGIYPLGRAWLANRSTSLLHSIQWAFLAWAAWGMVFASALAWPNGSAATAAYVALTLTGCAAVAVLGARRPQMIAWNFVVLALLAVNLLPVAEGLVTGGVPQLGTLRIVCVAGTIAVGVVNYLPTRMALAAIVLACACGAELWVIVQNGLTTDSKRALAATAELALIFAPWTALASMQRLARASAAFDALWLDFRDRFGLVWAQRVREQFSRSTAHAGWPVVLRWQGLRLVKGRALPEPNVQDEMIEKLRALMKRFLAEHVNEREAGDPVG
jgi:hypothetical protein